MPQLLLMLNVLVRIDKVRTEACPRRPGRKRADGRFAIWTGWTAW
jgi:hypothetical protein